MIEHVMPALHLHIEKWKSIFGCLALYYIGLGEMNCDSEQEPWMYELVGYDR